MEFVSTIDHSDHEYTEIEEQGTKKLMRMKLNKEKKLVMMTRSMKMRMIRKKRTKEQQKKRTVAKENLPMQMMTTMIQLL